MKRLTLIVIGSALLITQVFAAQRIARDQKVPAERQAKLEPTTQIFSTSNGNASPIYMPPERENILTLVDSSMNGYGLLVGETNPIDWDPVANRIFIAYRQWVGANGGSGVIGAALSEDGGQSFNTYSNLNVATGYSQAGRYPSAFATPNYPLIIWNEYGGGGGTQGGRAYYTYDEGEYNGAIFAPPADVSTTPTTNDIWQGSPCASYGPDGSMYVNAVFADWTDPRNKYNFRSTTSGAWDGTSLVWAPPQTILTQSQFLGTTSSNYTSSGVLDINDNGIGYFVVSSYWSDANAIANHTLFIKKTTNYGASWSTWYHIPDQVMNDYFRVQFPDSVYNESDGTWTVLSPDWTPFVDYDMDVMVDDDGGCHIFAGVLPSANSGVFPGWDITNGLYHFYSPQNDLTNWDINFVASLHSAWLLDDPGWQGVFPTAARDISLGNMMYVTWYTWPDVSSDVPYFDLMVAYSSDNGFSWSAPINISNTSDPNMDETDPHLARKADNGNIYMMYQMPDYNTPTVNPPATSEDYKNRLYFRTYNFFETTTVTFSVNMSFQIATGNFNPNTDFVDVAGTINGWGGGDVLTDPDGDGIYTLTLTGLELGEIEYKFRINGDWSTAEGDPNRTYIVQPGLNIIPTAWYNRQQPVEMINVEVLLQVDMTVQLLNGNFQPDNGDIVVVRGAPSQYGNWGGAIELTADPSTPNVYFRQDQFNNLPTGTPVEYKFVILRNGDVSNAIWENIPNRSWVPTGNEPDQNSNGYGEIIRPVVYFDDLPPDEILSQDVLVTFNVDLTSAYRALANGDPLIDTQTGSADVTDWSQVNGVCINGILGWWWNWGVDSECTSEWAMTQTDLSGFHYSYNYLYVAGQAKLQEYKYGINSFDNEAGFGNHHTLVINDNAPTWTAPEDCFGNENTNTSLPFPQECGPLFPAVIFRVNMDIQSQLGHFNPNTDVVELRGSFNGWGAQPLVMHPGETQHVYRIGVDFANFMAGDTAEYKFVIVKPDQDVWESRTNREFIYSGENMLLPLVWFNDVTNTESEMPWSLRITVDGGGIQEDNNYLGTIFGATNGYDAEIDIPEPAPAPSNFLQLYFPHPEWDIAIGPNFTTDYRAPVSLYANTLSWVFSVSTDLQSTPITLTFSERNELPFVMTFRLEDLSNGGTVDLNNNPNYTFASGNGGVTDFRITIGDILPDRMEHQFDPGWHLTSVPLMADETSVEMLFGAFTDQPYYVYDYQSGIGYSLVEQIFPGEGHWLANLAPFMASWGGLADTFPIEHQLSSGWNLIGLPYSYGKTLNSLTIQNGNTTVDFATAVQNGWVSGSVYGYTGNGYSLTDQLLPWEGYWLSALVDNLTLTYHFFEEPVNLLATEIRDENQWDLTLAAQTGNSADLITQIGVHSEATEGFDPQWDQPEPPLAPGGIQVSAFFEHSDWSPVLGSRFNRDIRPPIELEHQEVWPLTVQSTPGEVTLSWSYDSEQLPPYTYLRLIDIVHDVTINLNEATEYTFQNSTGQATFELVVNRTMVSIDETALPSEYALQPNYPNPFNPTTTLRYDLPDQGFVRITIYNQLGQLVRSLVNREESAGYKSMIWDARDNTGRQVGTGIYFYRIEVNGFTQTRKMVLLK